MVSICLLKQNQSKEMENFLVSVFGEESRALAQDYLSCAFSNDYRKPEFFAAIENERIIGSAAISEELFTVDMWGISWVAVAESHRNKGLGEKLIKACCDRIFDRAQVPVTVILGTYPNKTELYDRLGFQPAGKDHAGGSVMIKILRPEK